ncbi:hypothetical protein [Campylobacter sp. 2018MI10]|uniref:hypothetical protein n=1 Tax=Campylobacter sp. 2018MI10 TaxID=2836736 RepID=UPI001BDA8274|nr:hypothetical protein [Campylobacter sp. 2018MI10]MBT0884086.1 hypothetical protein [Campylobacter sp. 2018MI10]
MIKTIKIIVSPILPPFHPNKPKAKSKSYYKLIFIKNILNNIFMVFSVLENTTFTALKRLLAFSYIKYKKGQINEKT